jgi:hypothetical protein
LRHNAIHPRPVFSRQSARSSLNQFKFRTIEY